ncbi:MAG: hypothetical protein Q9228_007475, partial [Teloschistes exilis]
MHNESPVTNRGSSDVDVPAQERATTTYRARLRQEEAMVIRWAQLWRTIALSAMKKTLFPYTQYIRALNLEDLEELLEDSKFKDKVSSMFFKGELSKCKVQTNGPRGRLDAGSISNALGEIITTCTPMVEELSGKITNESLLRWIPRVPRLRLLSPWYGGSLVGAGPLLRQHCHAFKSLSLWGWNHDDADQKFADFLNEINPQTLESLEIFSHSAVGPESFLALSCHRESLTELKLNSVNETALKSLNMLAGCTNLTKLLLTDGSNRFIDLKNAHNDVFLETIAWLRSCKMLRAITIRDFRGGQDLITPILLENDICLTHLELKGYVMADARDFHRALSNQPSLLELHLQGDSDEAGEGGPVLVESLSQLVNLTDLRLQDVSDYFTDEVIGRLARSLPKLEGWYTSGWGVTDAIWPDIARLQSLRRLDMAATSRFTAEGILDFILTLGPGNKGLVLAVMMGEVEYNLSDEEQNMIRDTIAGGVDGRFEFQLQREADQKVITAHMCYAMTATTALTAQNTLGVHDIHHIPPTFVGKQIDACIEDIGVDVVKIGMLASAETINVVADALERHGKPTCVLDPVMVSTSGSQLLPDSAITTLIHRLLPLTTILTPNIPEARLLLHHANLIHHMNPVSPRKVTSSYDLVSLATSLQSLGPPHILIKGGHSPVDTAYNVATTPSSARWVQDILKTPDDLIFYTTDYSPHTNTHGTGCSLASAIACNLALSRTVPQACQNARLWIEAGIRSAPNLGRGRGPIDHFHSLQMRRQPPGG